VYLSGLYAVDYLWRSVGSIDTIFIKNIFFRIFRVRNLMFYIEEQHNLQTETQNMADNVGIF
jgi:hypothetical protein